MLNFTMHNPTKILFGKDMENLVGEETAKYSSKVLLHYGGQSIKKYGTYDKIVESLRKAGVDFVELGGVQPNPRLALVREGIELCRRENIRFILAVGGGSVIDSAKAIALGVPYDGDVWDFYEGKKPTEALPVATVLTIPAAGSESSQSSVITNAEKKRKLSVDDDLLFPVFSILAPNLCLTLPKNQIANGISDMMSHIMERYFTNTKNVELTDTLCENVLRVIIRNAYLLKEDDQNLDAWSEIMFAGCLAHNNLLGRGRQEDWASHVIEHELSAFYDIPHGAGLSIVTPAWMKHVYKHNVALFAQYAQRVFHVEGTLRDLDEMALAGIQALERFYTDMDLPTRMSHLHLDGGDIDAMAKGAYREGGTGNLKRLGVEDIKAIYKLAL